MSFFDEFPNTRTYDKELGWLIKQMKQVIINVDNQDAKIAAVEQLAQDLQEFVNNYFDDLDVQQEINNKINQMARDGSLLALIDDTVEDKTAETVEDWIAEHLTPSTTVVIDSSLSIAGAAADAKAVGDRFVTDEENFDYITGENKNIFTVTAESGGHTSTDFRWTIDRNTVTLTGTPGATGTIMLGTTTIPAGTYTISGFPLVKTSAGLRLQVRDYTGGSDAGSLVSATTTGTFTIEEEKQIAVRIYFVSGQRTDDVVNVQLERGRYATSFIQPLSTIKEEIENTVLPYMIRETHNILDIPDMINKTSNITYTVENGVIDLKSDGNTSGQGVIGFEDFPLAAGTYTLSGFRNGDVIAPMALQIREVLSDGTDTNVINTTNNATFTIDRDINARFRIYFPAGINLDHFKIYPQLEEGTTATDFIHHKVPVDEYARNNLILRDPGHSSVFITKATQEEMKACIKSYRDNHAALVYGDTKYLWSPIVVRGITDGIDLHPLTEADIGKYMVNCSTLVHLISRGIPFEHSQYVKTASTYKTAKSYVVGDVIFRSNAFYRCIRATTGSYNASDWTAITSGVYYYYEPYTSTIDRSTEGYYKYDNGSWTRLTETVDGETITWYKPERYYEYGYDFYGEEKYYTPGARFLRTYNLAEYLNDYGYLHDIDGFNNCAFGDIVIFALGSMYRVTDYYRYDHCGIFLGKRDNIVYIANFTGSDGATAPLIIHTYDLADATSPIQRAEKFGRVPVNIPTLAYSEYSDLL